MSPISFGGGAVRRETPSLPTRYVAGRYYPLAPMGGYPEPVQWEQGRLLCSPFFSYGLTISALASRVAVATPGEAGSLIRMGIYLNATSGHDRPDVLLIDAGTVAADVGGQKDITLGANLRIPDGLSWACYAPQLCPVTEPAVICSTGMVPLASAPSSWSTGEFAGVAADPGSVLGAFPASAPAVVPTTSGSPILIGKAV